MSTTETTTYGATSPSEEAIMAATTVTVTLHNGEPFDLLVSPAELNAMFSIDAWRVLAIDGATYTDARDAVVRHHSKGLVTFG